VQVRAVVEVQAHVGAALGAAEEDQIAGLQTMGDAALHGHRLAEAFLEIGIAGQPDPLGGIGGLHQAGTIKIRAQAAAPQVAVGLLEGTEAEGDYGIEPLPNGRAMPWPWPGMGLGFRPAQEGVGLDPPRIAVVEQPYPQAWLTAQGLGSFEHFQVAARPGLAGQSLAPLAAVEVDGPQQPPDAAGYQPFGSCRSSDGHGGRRIGLGTWGHGA